MLNTAFGYADGTVVATWITSIEGWNWYWFKLVVTLVEQGGHWRKSEVELEAKGKLHQKRAFEDFENQLKNVKK